MRKLVPVEVDFHLPNKKGIQKCHPKASARTSGGSEN